MENIFAVNKPIGMTSHDVVSLVRRTTGVKRVGHGGTLDPFASGVLVIAVGRENTKRLDEFVKGEKEYVAEILLGENSTTDDREGEKTVIDQTRQPTLEEITEAITPFIGNILQTPPIYSALKIGGKPAYSYARKGQEIEMKPREVFIKAIEIVDYTYPVLAIKVTTGPGVYIRSLARDIGEKLRTGGYLKSLIRTRVNTFSIEAALDLKDLDKD